MDVERVEFVDTPAPLPGGDDVVASGGGDHRPPGRWGLLVVGLLVVVVLASVLVGRVAGGSPSPSSRTANPAPVAARSSTPVTTTPVFGLVGLPEGVGEPTQLVTAQTGDVVWMLDHGSGITRIENGVVTGTTVLESQVTALAVSPSGDRLVVATAGEFAAVQELDPTTLRPGLSRHLDGRVQALAVSTDAVWAASGPSMLRLDLDRLDTFSSLAMPGVITTDHLRVQNEHAGGGEYVVGLTTSAGESGGAVSRFVRVDPVTDEVRFGPPIPHVSSVATSHFLTWATTSDDPAVSEGFTSVLDPEPTTEAADPLPTGSRIYDAGSAFAAFFSVAPRSSVISCRDDGGGARSEIDVSPAVPDAVITGQVLRTEVAFYVITDRGLVRSGVGACT